MLHTSRPDTLPAPGAQLDANGAAQAWRRDVVLKQILRPHAPTQATKPRSSAVPSRVGRQ